MKRIRVISLAVIAALSLTVTSFAADSSPQQQSAAAYLREAGIMLGNESGDMMLEHLAGGGNAGADGGAAHPNCHRSRAI